MIHYCETAQSKLQPCEVGWGSIGANGSKSCYDEPKEENCHMLVDDSQKDIQHCPCCGQVLQKLNGVTP